MTYTRKSYQIPELKSHPIETGNLLVKSNIALDKANSERNAHGDSKAFWGPSLFDEEDEEEYLDVEP